jgi:Uma2 family endonuclease
MSTVPKPRTARRRPRLVLRYVDWTTYTRLVRVFNERPAVRLTYDRGRLEIMSPLVVHDWSADFLGQMVVVMTEELRMPRKAGGSTTLKRRQLLKGLEPDKCYWLASEALMRGKERLDLAVDPPPDLAIEVDVTSSSLNRMKIYAALGVREVWRVEGGVLTFHVLAGGAYTPASPSPTFPLVTPADLLTFLALVGTQGEMSALLQFRDWFRQRLAAQSQTP